MSDLERRRDALTATRSKYKGRRCDYRSADCIRMVRSHLIQMGHKPPKLPRYQSPIGARRALALAGGMVAIFDRLLPRIAPARMLPGDIAVVAGDEAEAALILVQADHYMGWHQDSDVAVDIVIDARLLTAWRA